MRKNEQKLQIVPNQRLDRGNTFAGIPVTALSGGQSRALAIADTPFLINRSHCVH